MLRVWYVFRVSSNLGNGVRLCDSLFPIIKVTRDFIGLHLLVDRLILGLVRFYQFCWAETTTRDES